MKYLNSNCSLSSNIGNSDTITFKVKTKKSFKRMIHICKFVFFRTDSSMERTRGIEPPSQPWQGRILTIEPRSHINWRGLPDLNR